MFIFCGSLGAKFPGEHRVQGCKTSKARDNSVFVGEDQDSSPPFSSPSLSEDRCFFIGWPRYPIFTVLCQCDLPIVGIYTYLLLHPRFFCHFAGDSKKLPCLLVRFSSGEAPIWLLSAWNFSHIASSSSQDHFDVPVNIPPNGRESRSRVLREYACTAALPERASDSSPETKTGLSFVSIGALSTVAVDSLGFSALVLA